MFNLKKFPNLEQIIKQKTSQLEIDSNLNFKGFKSENSLFFPRNINFNMNSKNNGELIELIFFGLNYNAKRVKYNRKPFLLDLQKSHKIRVSESRISKVKTKVFKRRLLLFSFDKNNLKNLELNLKSNRPKNSYSGHGVISRTDKYETKPGKIRQK